MAKSRRIKLGWYHIEESVDSEGDIDLAIRDPRTGELVVCKVDLESQTKLLEFLDKNRQIGVLSQLKAVSA